MTHDGGGVIPIADVVAFLVGLDYGDGLTGGDILLPEALCMPLAKAYRDADTDGDQTPIETVEDYYAMLAENCGWPEGWGVTDVR